MRIPKEQSIFVMSAKQKTVAAVKSGDTVVFETLDCFSDTLKQESDLFGTVPWDRINPATGPIYVEDAEPGDALKVEILEIKLADHGVTALAPGHGVFGDSVKEEVTRIVPVQDGMVHFSEKVVVPIRPMIGVIGTAPAAGEEIPTGTPGAHGGNMDCKEITTGTTLYLPVNTPGALLAMGDVHAVMGDGEVSVCGIEINSEITVRVSVVKQSGLPLPFLVNDTSLMTLYSADTLDEAATGAAKLMHQFVHNELGVEYNEAVMLLSTVADLRICQVVDPLKTCRMELPRSVAEAYGELSL